MFWNIDIGQGVVVFDDISFLPEVFDAAQHVDYLKEDLLKIVFGDDLVLDAGWYPSFDEHGRFLLMLVRDGNWDEPVERAEFTEVVALKARIACIAGKLSRPV
ncbi:hypothetical protein CR152_14780 [Massilia violaceinigra]|uniref:Uncharacterized protein n=1 Tax=Massilia violaceinigra TaxID=2045208 RepID=A0A2D2DKX6_9BURK|nr:hypothetical protein [Massilia violaceinigra]ATQ75649.1 hypothetical protein CR152_14780 [Massilia violaceinigra]